MKDGVPSLPLFDLPNGPLKCVLQNMELFHQIGFSILSKRSKELVTSLNLKAPVLTVTIGRYISLSYLSQNRPYVWEFYKKVSHIAVENNLFPVEMYTPDYVRVSIQGPRGGTKRYKWENPGFEIKDWIDHFLSIFNLPKVDKLQFHGRAEFDLNSLHKTINDVNEIDINDHFSVSYIQKVVKTYPCAKKMDLSFDDEHNQENFHSLFCQNFDFLTLNEYPGIGRVTLNDLLIMNSRIIEIDNSNLPQEDLNKFLKLWKNGSNSRMEYFEIMFNQDIRFNLGVLDGLDSQLVPPEHKRELIEPIRGRDYIHIVSLNCVYDIRRNDGTTGIIIVHGPLPDRLFALKVFVRH